MSNKTPIHFDGYCVFHDLPVIQYDQCKECLNEDPSALELPDPFEEVLGG